MHVSPAVLMLLCTLLLPACAPGGSGGSSLAEGFDPGGELPEDIGGGGQTGVFTIEYPLVYGFLPIGTPLEELLPTLSAAADGFEIAPALPAGLVLDPTTGALSGTPAAAAPRQSYTITAFNEFGSAQTSFELEVPGIARFAYVTSSGDSSLSAFSIDAANGRLQHRSYLPASDFQIGPEAVAVHPQGLWIYVANAGTATLGTLSVDLGSGALTVIDSDAIGSGPHAIGVHPEGRFVYVVSNAVGTLRGFRRHPQTGELDQVGTAVSLEADPVGLMLAPNGRYLVTVHRAPALLVSYRIDTASGQVFLAQELALAEGSAPLGGAIGVASDQAYLTLATEESVARISIDPISAQMEFLDTRPTELEPNALALRPRGDFAYVLNDASKKSKEKGGPSLSVYAVDAETGELSDPTHVPLEGSPSNPGFSPDGTLLYLVDREASSVTVHAIHSESGLPVPGDFVRTRQLPSTVAIVGGDAPARVRARHLYVGGSETGELSVFDVDPLAGQLTSIGPPVETGARITDIAIDPFNRYLWVADTSLGKENLLVMSIGADGVPSLLHVVLFGVRPVAAAVEPSGRFLYVATDDVANGVFALAIQPDGSLTSIDFAGVGFSPRAVEVDPTGQFLYVVNSALDEPGNQGDISMFIIDPETGTMTSVLPPGLAGGGPTSLAFSASGARAYSTYSNVGFIGTYDLQPTDGRLMLVLMATITGPRPLDLGLTPDGRFAYAAINDPGGSGHVELYDVRAEDGVLYNADSGLLEARANFLAGNQPTALELDPSGRNLYVLNRTSATVTTFAVDPQSGGLIVVDLDGVPPAPAAMAISTVVE